MNRKNNYKGVTCPCGVSVSIGSKSGKCKSCAARGKKLSIITRKKMASAKLGNTYGIGNKGKRMSEKTKKRMSETHLGVRFTQERIEKQVKNRKGQNSHFWKGGLTSANRIIRGSYQYSFWRKSVFERDNYTCTNCGKRGCYLEADHIKQFALHPELRFEVSNGRTLCKPCHKETPTYLWKGKNTNYATAFTSKKDSGE